MPTIYEPLNRGIKTAIDPMMMEPGQLQTADNARYRPGDQAIWHAEGRQMLGTGQQGPQADFSYNTPGGAVALNWPAGSNRDQLVWMHDPANAYVMSMDEAPESTLHNSATLHSLTTGNFPMGNGVGPTKNVVINDPNNNTYTNVLMTSSKPFVTYRDLSHQIRFAPLGLPQGQQEVAVNGVPTGTVRIDYDSTTVSAAGVWENVSPGWNFAEWWAVWYNEDLNVESGAIAGISNEGGYNAFGIATEPIFKMIPNNLLNFKITLPAPGSRPRGATHVRIYRTKIPYNYVTIKGLQYVPRHFPNGIQVGEIPLADVNPFGGAADPWVYLNAESTEIAWSDGGNIALQVKTWGRTFPSVTVSTGGQALTVPRAGPIPSGITGAYFDGSFVMSDSTQGNRLWFSFPGEPHHIPETFWIDIPSTEGDTIVSIEQIGQVLLVFMTNSVWRINWLPSATEFDFRRGDMITLVSAGQGVLSHLATAKINWPGMGVAVAFVGPNGLFVTNGYDLMEASSEQDWGSLVSGHGAYASAILINNMNEFRLELFLQGPNDYGRQSIYLIHYHPSHLGSSGLPAMTGPCKRTGISLAAVGMTVNRAVHRTISICTKSFPSDGVEEDSLWTTIFYEWFGFQDDTTGSNLFLKIRTRELYTSGIGTNKFLSNGIAHVKANQFGGGGFGITFELYPGPRVRSEAFVSNTRKLVLPTLAGDSEYAIVEITGATLQETIAVSINLVGFDYEDRGAVNRG